MMRLEEDEMVALHGENLMENQADGVDAVLGRFQVPSKKSDESLEMEFKSPGIRLYL